jgi:PilZ domain
MVGSGDGPLQSSNRRTAFRLPTAFDVRVRSDGTAKGTEDWPRVDRGAARVLTTVTEDVSAGGLRFRAPARLPRGTPLTVSFALDDVPVEAEGAVAHVSADDFGAGIGVTFVGIDGATTSRLVRFITARERERLPTVPIMYSINCHVDRERAELDGATEECSPRFMRLLLSRAVQPGEHLAIVVNVGRTEMRLAGRAVSCRPADQLWRTEVELGDLGPVASQWRDVVVRLRDSSR